MQPADLQLSNNLLDKRGRFAIGQTPETPAKAETKADVNQTLDPEQPAEAGRPESPVLELSDGEEVFAETDSSIEITPATRIKV